jgi:hypothetical protein
MSTPSRTTLLPLGPMARLIGVSSDWLRAEAEAGRLPHLPAGKTILFDPDLVEQLLTERARRLPKQEEEARHAG